jgi:hypothetical protein
MTTTDTTLRAARFITGTTTTEVEKRVANLAATAADLAATETEFVPAAMKATGPPVRTLAVPAGLKTAPPQRPGLLKETTTLLEDTLNLAVRAASARLPSAATTTAERQGAIHRAEVPASVAEQRVVAVSRIGNRRIVMFLVACKI